MEAALYFDCFFFSPDGSKGHILYMQLFSLLPSAVTVIHLTWSMPCLAQALTLPSCTAELKTLRAEHKSTGLHTQVRAQAHARA